MNTKLINFARIAKRYFSEEGDPSPVEAKILASAALILTDTKRKLIYDTITALNTYFKGNIVNGVAKSAGVRETKYPIFLSYLSTKSVESQIMASQMFISMLNGIIREVSKIQKEPSFVSAKEDLFMRTLQTSTDPLFVTGQIFNSKTMVAPWTVTADGSKLTLSANNDYVFSTTSTAVDAYKNFFNFILNEVYSYLNITEANIKDSGVSFA